MRFVSMLSACAFLAGAHLSAEPNVPPEFLPRAREAKEQFERGNYAEAEKAYREILAKAPKDLYTLSNLGVVLFRAGKFEESAKVLREAIAVAPEDGFSHSTLGIVYYSQRKYDEAVDELTKALAIDPKNASAHNYLGIVAQQKGWQELARKEIETARRLDPSFSAPDELGSHIKGVGDFLTPLEQQRGQSPPLDLSPSGPRPAR